MGGWVVVEGCVCGVRSDVPVTSEALERVTPPPPHSLPPPLPASLQVACGRLAMQAAAVLQSLGARATERRGELRAAMRNVKSVVESSFANVLRTVRLRKAIALEKARMLTENVRLTGGRVWLVPWVFGGLID
jgi:hypothetical protein